MNTNGLMSDKKAYSIHTTSGMDMDGLIKAIRHTNLGIRWRAALALGDIGEPAVKPLIHALKETEDQDVRWLAGLALGRIGEAAIPQLIRAMSEDDYDVRWHATRVLAEIGRTGNRTAYRHAAGRGQRCPVEECLRPLADWGTGSRSPDPCPEKQEMVGAGQGNLGARGDPRPAGCRTADPVGERPGLVRPVERCRCPGQDWRQACSHVPWEGTEGVGLVCPGPVHLGTWQTRAAMPR